MAGYKCLSYLVFFLALFHSLQAQETTPEKKAETTTEAAPDKEVPTGSTDATASDKAENGTEVIAAGGAASEATSQGNDSGTIVDEVDEPELIPETPPETETTSPGDLEEIDVTDLNKFETPADMNANATTATASPTEPTPTPIDVQEMLTYMAPNGGDPQSQPNKHLPGSRHVKAHDGFHSLKKEKYWAHWNDQFTKPDVAEEAPF